MSDEIKSTCQVCNRPIYFTKENGYWKHSGGWNPRHIPLVPAHLEIKTKTLAEKVEEQENALRDLACYLGVGGYNDCGLVDFDAKKYVEKIKQGIIDYIESEINRQK